MFPTPQITPVSPTAALESASTMLHFVGLDTAILLIIAFTLAFSLWWLLVGRNGNDD